MIRPTVSWLAKIGLANSLAISKESSFPRGKTLTAFSTLFNRVERCGVRKSRAFAAGFQISMACPRSRAFDRRCANA